MIDVQLLAKEMLRGGSRALAPIAQAGAFSLDDITPRSAYKPKYDPLCAIINICTIS